MAEANTKSTAVTNADATPAELTGPHIAEGRLRESVGTVEVAAADDNNSVYRFFRVHSSWRISSLELLNDAIQSGTTYDIGLHEIAAAGGAAKDADLFGTDVDMTSARVAPTDVLFEALNIDKIEKRIWEMLGETEDPDRWYDLTMTGQVAGSGAGTISMRGRFAGA